MSTGNPRPDGVRIDAALVRRLISLQFPRWADLPVRPVEAGGWDNRTFRLGPRMTARLLAAAKRLPFAEGEGRARGWSERHLLLAADPRRAAVLARRFRQSAVVVVRSGAPARLILLRRMLVPG